MELEIYITEWNGKTSRALNNNKEGHFLTQVWSRVGISYHTMYKYVGKNPEHRHKVGVGVARQCLILPVDQKFVVDVMARKYRENEGLAMSGNIYLIQDIMPNISCVQYQKRFLHTIQHKDRHNSK